ncbi:hypothetical protein K9D67_004749, partial [Vibrio parahaemolyticus]|nr:hypothetical protein [Vibrio parahaemolyticus]
MNIVNERSRLDTIIVWGHGLSHLNSIVKMIRDTEYFEIIRFIKHKPKSMKKFVNQVYSYDYAPLVHLKSKIKYLEKVEPCLMCIVIKNKSPMVDILGEGNFRHKESLRLKNLKTKIREEFNPYIDGNMTHDHIIHATDNEEQTYHILNAIGVENISDYYQDNYFSIPFFVGKLNSYKILEINIEELYCGQVKGDEFNYIVTNVPLSDSVQYQALVSKDARKKYSNYIEKYRGTAIKADHDLLRYLELSNDFLYLSAGNETKFVTVKRNEKNQYVIVDGLHRASIHLYQ